MSDNTRLWDRFERTDPKFTKDFTRGGGFSGTAINPMYSAKKMTEAFGPCGIGWGSEEIEHLLLEGADGVRVWKSKVKVWYILDGQRGEIQQWGATEFVTKKKGALVTDEEAAKKSYTDAETKCFSKLGLGADIYLKLRDGCKWTADEPAEDKPAPKKEDAPFDIAKGLISNLRKFKDKDTAVGFQKAMTIGRNIPVRHKDKAFSLPEATQLVIHWVPAALMLSGSTEQTYEVLALVEQFHKTDGLLSDETCSNLSKACTDKLKEQ